MPQNSHWLQSSRMFRKEFLCLQSRLILDLAWMMLWLVVDDLMVVGLAVPDFEGKQIDIWVQSRAFCFHFAGKAKDIEETEENVLPTPMFYCHTCLLLFLLHRFHEFDKIFPKGIWKSYCWSWDINTKVFCSHFCVTYWCLYVASHCVCSLNPSISKAST